MDSDWIDYENGILFFPESEPFPAAVYDSEDRQSYYELEAAYQTEFSLIQLEQKNLVRGTEVVKLDGVKAEGGSVYVLDYTNGTLVFVKDMPLASGIGFDLSEYPIRAKDRVQKNTVLQIVSAVDAKEEQFTAMRVDVFQITDNGGTRLNRLDL